MSEMTPEESLGPDDLRRLADLLERPTKYGATTARWAMRACAYDWQADRIHIRELDHLREVEKADFERAHGELVAQFLAAQARIEALEKRLMANDRLRRAAENLWGFTIPRNDYGWTVSDEYHLLKTEFDDAVVGVILIEAGYDPATVAENARAVARQAREAVLAAEKKP